MSKGEGVQTRSAAQEKSDDATMADIFNSVRVFRDNDMKIDALEEKIAEIQGTNSIILLVVSSVKSMLYFNDKFSIAIKCTYMDYTTTESELNQKLEVCGVDEPKLCIITTLLVDRVIRTGVNFMTIILYECPNPLIDFVNRHKLKSSLDSIEVFVNKEDVEFMPDGLKKMAEKKFEQRFNFKEIKHPTWPMLMDTISRVSTLTDQDLKGMMDLLTFLEPKYNPSESGEVVINWEKLPFSTVFRLIDFIEDCKPIVK